VTALCQRPDCGGTVVGWLDREYCSKACRFAHLHPDLGRDDVESREAGILWVGAQALKCNQPASSRTGCGCGDPA
jgi:hypothetical protein